MSKTGSQKQLFGVIHKSLDVAVKITVSLYVFPFLFAPFLIVYNFTLSTENAFGLLTFPFAVALFLYHVFYTKKYIDFNKEDIWNDPVNTKLFLSAIYYLFLSFVFALYTLSFLNQNLGSTLDFVNVFENSRQLGEVVVFFFGFSLILLFWEFIVQRFQDHSSILIRVTICIFVFLLSLLIFINLEEIALKYSYFGNFLLGPVNLLIAKLLFTRKMYE